MRHSISLAVAAAAAAAVTFPTTAMAVYDTDHVAAQTTGARAAGPVTWYNSAGQGRANITLYDTSAADQRCVTLSVRRRFTNGSVQSWIRMGSVCGGRSAGFLFDVGPGSSAVSHLDVRVTREGYGNYDIYSVSPGGA